MTNTNTDKNVYLLGAGFSKEIGLPLQDDFLLVAKEVYFKDTSRYRHFKRVFEYQDKLSKMRQFLNYPLLNLEHLFNLIEMDIFYSKSTKVKKIKDDFAKLICDVLVDKTPCPFTHNRSGSLVQDQKYKNYISFMSLFIEKDKHQLSTHKDTIISFNYDLILEGASCIYNWKRNERHQYSHAQSNNFIQFNTIFGKENIIVDQVNQYFTQNRPNSYFPPMNLFSTDDEALKLVKLHGSINWKTSSNDQTFIVPPTWNKSNPQIRKLWEVAYNEIMTAKRIIIIGYSFPETDIYVKSLLALALNENKILQNIFFVNPDKEIAKNACLSLLDKHFQKYCDYKEWKFSDFIASDEGKKFIKNLLNREVSH